MKEIYSLYKITNVITNLCYIGITIRDPEKRFTEHKRLANAGKGHSIHKVIHQFGKENFILEVLCTLTDRRDAYKKEVELIKLYDSFNNGYNLTKGGGYMSDKGRKLSSERMKTNNPMKNRTNSGSFKMGHTQLTSKETKEKIRESKKGSNNINFNNPDASKHLTKRGCCIKCHTETSIGNLVRWHGVNCRHNILTNRLPSEVTS